MPEPARNWGCCDTQTWIVEPSATANQFRHHLCAYLLYYPPILGVLSADA